MLIEIYGKFQKNKNFKDITHENNNKKFTNTYNCVSFKNLFLRINIYEKR